MTSTIDGDSVTTERVDYASFSDGVTTVVNDYSPGSGDELRRFVQPTDGVSTSATTIFNRRQEGSALASHFLVIGVDASSSTTRFVDVILNEAGTFSVTDFIDTNSPAGRTYSESSNEVKLAMASDTYNVLASALAGLAG